MSDYCPLHGTYFESEKISGYDGCPRCFIAGNRIKTEESEDADEERKGGK